MKLSLPEVVVLYVSAPPFCSRAGRSVVSVAGGSGVALLLLLDPVPLEVKNMRGGVSARVERFWCIFYSAAGC